MNLEIDEFQEIIDGEWPGGAIQGRKPNEDEMRRALQVMLTRQGIYSSTPGLGRTYEIVKPRFLLRTLLRDARLPPRHLSARPDGRPVGPEGGLPLRRRLRTPSQDETIVLLALRLLWEEAIVGQDIGDG